MVTPFTTTSFVLLTARLSLSASRCSAAFIEARSAASAVFGLIAAPVVAGMRSARSATILSLAAVAVGDGVAIGLAVVSRVIPVSV